MSRMKPEVIRYRHIDNIDESSKTLEELNDEIQAQ